MVTSSFLAGALMSTFFAPASRCTRALSASVKRPVDDVVDRHDLDVRGALDELLEGLAADATEPVDAHAYGHVSNLRCAARWIGGARPRQALPGGVPGDAGAVPPRHARDSPRTAQRETRSRFGASGPSRRPADQRRRMTGLPRRLGREMAVG